MQRRRNGLRNHVAGRQSAQRRVRNSWRHADAIRSEIAGLRPKGDHASRPALSIIPEIFRRQMNRVALLRLAAAFCFLAVALGAFGAHALKAKLEVSGMLDVWNKAVLYHFLHAIALVA